MSPELAILASDHLSIGVAPMGAEMQFMRTASGADLLWNGDAAFWTGRAPVLFPIVGRAVDDIVEAGGVRADMKQHGFARRSVFTLEDASGSHCRHILQASDATRAVYPFDFSLAVTHAVDGAVLSVGAEITNAGANDMPFGFGFHPAFRWPLPSATGPLRVQMADGQSPLRRPLRSDGLLQAELVEGPMQDGALDITDAAFADGALVFPGGSGPLRYGADDGIALAFTFENLPDLALWRPVGAPFLCVEPWHGTASLVGDGPDIAHRPNSVILAPGRTVRFGYQVTVTSA